MSDKHFYEEAREAIDAVVVAFEDLNLTYREAISIGTAAYEAGSHFAEAMRDDDAHFEHLILEINRPIDDAWAWINTKVDVPWVPEEGEELLFGSAAALSKWIAGKQLRERRQQVIGG